MTRKKLTWWACVTALLLVLAIGLHIARSHDGQSVGEWMETGTSTTTIPERCIDTWPHCTLVGAEPTTTTQPPAATVPPTTTTEKSAPEPEAIEPNIEPEPEEEVAPAYTASESGIPDSYWDLLASCETGGNWQHYPDGRWSGGLGIYDRTWAGWGGHEFASNAGYATREQQIIVANRIAADVGISGWQGCLVQIGYP